MGCDVIWCDMTWSDGMGWDVLYDVYWCTACNVLCAWCSVVYCTLLLFLSLSLFSSHLPLLIFSHLLSIPLLSSPPTLSSPLTNTYTTHRSTIYPNLLFTPLLLSPPLSSPVHLSPPLSSPVHLSPPLSSPVHLSPLLFSPLLRFTSAIFSYSPLPSSPLPSSPPPLFSSPLLSPLLLSLMHRYSEVDSVDVDQQIQNDLDDELDGHERVRTIYMMYSNILYWVMYAYISSTSMTCNMHAFHFIEECHVSENRSVFWRQKVSLLILLFIIILVEYPPLPPLFLLPRLT